MRSAIKVLFSWRSGLEFKRLKLERRGNSLLTYKATYKFLTEGVHCEVLDFPGVLTCAQSLQEARILLSGALVDMAETYLLSGEALPLPNPELSEPEADLEEPIYLILQSSAYVNVTPIALAS
jgi:predicted RNase H-like HicB family nuclease